MALLLNAFRGSARVCKEADVRRRSVKLNKPLGWQYCDRADRAGQHPLPSCWSRGWGGRDVLVTDIVPIFFGRLAQTRQSRNLRRVPAWAPSVYALRGDKNLGVAEKRTDAPPTQQIQFSAAPNCRGFLAASQATLVIRSGTRGVNAAASTGRSRGRGFSPSSTYVYCFRAG